MKIKITIIVTALISGCSGLTMNEGSTPFGTLTEIRDANTHIRKYEKIPENATELTSISADRCHRGYDAPTEGTITTDLVMTAYAYGYDGIKLGEIRKQTGLIQNCWYILSGTAQVFKLSK